MAQPQTPRTDQEKTKLMTIHPMQSSNQAPSIAMLPLAKIRSLRDCGKDEYWLQEFIYNDPSMLGLGDLERVSREKRTASGGRLDLLLKDPKDDGMFEVEVMLGGVDESHIVRTIEYWDLEKRRFPLRRHTAVLVAEKINSRFYNVVNILSQSIPIVGIQVNAIDLDGKLGVHFTKIVDSYQEPEIESSSESAQFDERYWTSTYPDQSNFAKAYKGLASRFFEDVNLRFLEQYMVLTIGRYDRIKLKGRKNGYTQIEYRIAEGKLEAAEAACREHGVEPRVNGDKLTFETNSACFEKNKNLHELLLRSLYDRDLTFKSSKAA
jgi:hypothetical protein